MESKEQRKGAQIQSRLLEAQSGEAGGKSVTTKRINKPRRIIHDVEELPVVCDAAEAGLLLRLTPETVARMARQGTLPGRKQGQVWFFRRDDLTAYLDALFSQEVAQ